MKNTLSPAISVCMIVKNEGENLRPCLESLGDLASEIIVVDTGSSDDTVKIAEALRAKVVRFDWIDDFAAARNESLRHATSDWVFWLDADDRLSPTAVAQLGRAAVSGKADAYACLVSSLEPDGRVNSVEHVRLFRNGLGISFSGAIHETVAPDLARLGLRLAGTDIVVQHTGYRSVEVIRQKSKRNLPVIERQIAMHPEQVDLLFYRGHSLTNVGRLEEGLADMREFLARSRSRKAFHYTRFLAYATCVSILDIRDDRASMERLLRQALEEFPGHPHFRFLLARLTLLRGQPAAALQSLLATYQAMQQPVRGMRPPDAWVELAIAEASRAVGQKQSAVEWAERARKHSPDWSMAATFLVRLYLDSGMVAEAESLLAGLLSSTRSAEPWIILSQLRRQQGRVEEAVAAVREAESRGLLRAEQAKKLLSRLRTAATPAGSTSRQQPSNGAMSQQQRGIDLLGRRDFVDAAQCFAGAIDAAPKDPVNYRYLAAALKALGREREAIEAWLLADHWEGRL